MNLTMDEIIDIIEAEDVSVDDEHPDHFSLQESEYVTLPFATVNKEYAAYYADGDAYADMSVWVMQIYTAEEYPEAVEGIVERLGGAGQRPEYTRAFLSDYSVYRHQLRF